MVKRKRQQVTVADSSAATTPSKTNKKAKANGKASAAPPAKTQDATGSSKSTATATSTATSTATATATDTRQSETLQIIAGSYDQVLHGMTATLTLTLTPTQDSEAIDCQFADTFLFNAHSSAVRCVAVSPVSPPLPNQARKVLLATGSTDERVHVYSLSAHPPPRPKANISNDINSGSGSGSSSRSILPRRVLENPRNRELGTLLHHASTITTLLFPTRSKLLTASADSTIAVARARDWSVLSTIKVPVPKVVGRPSGDTAAAGLAPSGVNDVAVHPSLKLMISVSRGERCMRLWNLVTGKKAGVLGFARGMLAQIGEGKRASGEGRRVVWGCGGDDGEEKDDDDDDDGEHGKEQGGGEEFAVAFEWDVVVFGMDSVPRCRVMPCRSKIHRIAYVNLSASSAVASGTRSMVLAVSTEDGRVLFFSTRTRDLVQKERDDQNCRAQDDKDTALLPLAKLVGQLGGKEAGVTGRIKDFVVLRSEVRSGLVYFVTACSDGKVRVWMVDEERLRSGGGDGDGDGGSGVGRLAGVYETHNRITCLTGFVMVPRPDGVEEWDVEEEEGGEEGDGSDGSESESEVE